MLITKTWILKIRAKLWSQEPNTKQGFWTKIYRLTIVHMLLCYTVALMKLNDVILHAWNLLFWMEEQYKRNVYLLFCLMKKGFSFIYTSIWQGKKRTATWHFRNIFWGQIRGLDADQHSSFWQSPINEILNSCWCISPHTCQN